MKVWRGGRGVGWGKGGEEGGTGEGGGQQQSGTINFFKRHYRTVQEP